MRKKKHKWSAGRRSLRAEVQLEFVKRWWDAMCLRVVLEFCDLVHFIQGAKVSSVRSVSLLVSTCYICSREGSGWRKATQTSLGGALCEVYGTNNSTETSRCIEAPKLNQWPCGAKLGWKPSANIWRVVKDTSVQLWSALWPKSIFIHGAP